MNMVVRLALLAIVLCFPASAVAQVQYGTGIICDSPEQVESFAVRSAIDGAEKAVAFVNVEAKSATACGVVTVAFLEGPQAKQLVVNDSLIRIVEIAIVGVHLGVGWRPTTPFKQFTMFLVEGRGT